MLLHLCFTSDLDITESAVKLERPSLLLGFAVRLLHVMKKKGLCLCAEENLFADLTLPAGQAQRQPHLSLTSKFLQSLDLGSWQGVCVGEMGDQHPCIGFQVATVVHQALKHVNLVLLGRVRF